MVAVVSQGPTHGVSVICYAAKARDALAILRDANGAAVEGVGRKSSEKLALIVVVTMPGPKDGFVAARIIGEIVIGCRARGLSETDDDTPALRDGDGGAIHRTRW